MLWLGRGRVLVVGQAVGVGRDKPKREGVSLGGVTEPCRRIRKFLGGEVLSLRVLWVLLEGRTPVVLWLSVSGKSGVTVPGRFCVRTASVGDASCNQLNRLSRVAVFRSLVLVQPGLSLKGGNRV